MGNVIVEPEDEKAYNLMARVMPKDFTPADPDEVEKNIKEAKEEDLAAKIIAHRVIEKLEEEKKKG